MLARKNVMIDNELWSKLELIRVYKKQTDAQASISKIINEALRKYIEDEKLDNFDIALKLFAKPMSKEEAEEVSEMLKNFTKEDKETAAVIKLDKIPETAENEISDLIKWANE